MGIPNVAPLTVKIRRGSEGGGEFARVCDLLLRAEFNYLRHEFWSADDSCGDYRGADATLRKFWSYGDGSEQHIAFQYKFCAHPWSNDTKRRIRDSLRSALPFLLDRARKPGLSNGLVPKWVLVTPEDVNRHDAAWFYELPPSVSG